MSDRDTRREESADSRRDTAIVLRNWGRATDPRDPVVDTTKEDEKAYWIEHKWEEDVEYRLFHERKEDRP